MMAADMSGLSYLQLDALREIGTIGAGHAATALSQLLHTRVNMLVPRVSAVPLHEVPYLVGGPETPVVGVFLKLFGDVPGNVLFLLPKDSSETLVDLVTGQPVGTTRNIDDEFEQSVIKEIVNILTSAHLNALTMMLKLVMLPSVPALAQDMAGALLNAVLAEFGEAADCAIVVETKFSLPFRDIIGYFFLIPHPDALATMMQALGV
jgi:chemotaxis protein CheC